MAKSTVAVRFTGDASDLKRTMGRLDDGFRKVGKDGLVAAGGIAAVGAGAFAAGSMVLDLGGQLTSFRQKTSTVFEGSAKDVRLWADTNNEAFGLPVARVRWTGVVLAGMLAALGGAWLALEQHQFTAGMSSGRGYIALAALVFGKWRPAGAALACLLFGAAGQCRSSCKAARSVCRRSSCKCCRTW